MKLGDAEGLVGYELDTGHERWRILATDRGQPPVIAGTTLVLMWNGTLSALSTRDGSTLWTTEQQSPRRPPWRACKPAKIVGASPADETRSERGEGQGFDESG